MNLKPIAPTELYLHNWRPGSAAEIFLERCYDTDVKYHHDDKYQKLVNNIKEIISAVEEDEEILWDTKISKLCKKLKKVVE